ncbi:MAG: hypothetical protein RBS13_00425 [Bacteroidales bacterium]|nr:hypothetical protein [Bacteroidales bacterium]
MRHYFIIVFGVLIIQTNLNAQSYRKTIKPLQSETLSPLLSESSGLIYWENALWTHNDSRDINLYCLDTLDGTLLDSIALQGIVNIDIEEISQDEDYIYLLDAGNNSGIRSDLHILIISKESLLQRQPKIDTLWFSYEDRYDLETSSSNTSDFDCEAFIIAGDSIYLFTKQWKQQGSKMYVLPKAVGNHTALLRDSLPNIGLLTGVVYFAELNRLVFCGYNLNLQPFLLFLYDFEGHDFFGGSQRKIKINLPFHQVEAITSQDGERFYLTNETFKRAGIEVAAQWHMIDLSDLDFDPEE